MTSAEILERRSRAPPNAQNRFVNTASSKHMRSKTHDDKENSGNKSEIEEGGDDLDDQLWAIYATKSKRPPANPTNQRGLFPCIEREALMHYQSM